VAHLSSSSESADVVRPPPPDGPDGSAEARGARPGCGVWWLSIAWLLVACAGVGLVVLSWPWLPYVLLGLLVLAALVWTFVSVLSPAIPDRTCPNCGGEGLVKIRRGELGVRCQLCGFVDESMHRAYLDEW